MMAFLHGFCLALGLILPLGVQNLFVFQQGVVQPKLSGVLPVVITAALCDTVLIILAVSGISVLLIKFMVLKNILVVCGVIFLFYMGYLNWRSDSTKNKIDNTYLSAKQQIVFAMSVSLLNPYAFLDIIGVIGTSSLQYEYEEKILFTTACIMVSWLWFSGLGIAGQILGSMENLAEKMQHINKMASIFIWGTGIFLLCKLF